jgi:hypothetical protein
MIVCSKFGLGITVGKSYKIMGEFSNSYFIVNDLGNKLLYNKNKFVTLSDWRKIKLKELGI